MDEEQLKKMAEFEDKNPSYIISPTLLQKLAGMDGTEQITEAMPKLKQHFFYVAWQDDAGRIIDIKHYDDYDMALMRAMQNAKLTATTYTIRDLKGRLVDSNYVSK